MTDCVWTRKKRHTRLPCVGLKPTCSTVALLAWVVAASTPAVCSPFLSSGPCGEWSTGLLVASLFTVSQRGTQLSVLRIWPPWPTQPSNALTSVHRPGRNSGGGRRMWSRLWWACYCGLLQPTDRTVEILSRIPRPPWRWLQHSRPGQWHLRDRLVQWWHFLVDKLLLNKQVQLVP